MTINLFAVLEDFLKVVETSGPPIAGTEYQSFDVVVKNDGGVIKHKIVAPNQGLSGVVAPDLASGVQGASGLYTATPTGADATTGFAAGAKIASANQHQLYLDTEDHDVNEAELSAAITYTNGSSPIPQVNITLLDRDVNGVTISRPTIQLLTDNASGGLSFANHLAVGDSIRIAVRGYLKPRVTTP